MPSPNFSPGSIKCVNKMFHKILNKVAHKILIKCFLQPSTICSDRKKSHSHVTCHIRVCLGKILHIDMAPSEIMTIPEIIKALEDEMFHLMQGLKNLLRIFLCSFGNFLIPEI